MATIPQISIRGVRKSIPSGYVIGRGQGQKTNAPVQLVPTTAFAPGAGAGGGVAAGGAPTGQMLANNTIAANISGGTAAATGVSISTLLESVYSPTYNQSIVYNGTTFVAKVAGVLPLVNGAGGGSGLIQDPSGQCIGVPL